MIDQFYKLNNPNSKLVDDLKIKVIKNSKTNPVSRNTFLHCHLRDTVKKGVPFSQLQAGIQPVNI